MEGPSLVSTAGVTDRIHGCDGMILLRGIAFRQGQPPWSSGVVHIAYLPDAYLPDGCVADLPRWCGSWTTAHGGFPCRSG